MFRFADDLRVCILYTVFRQNSRGPISATPYNLSMNCTLLTVRLRAQWCQGVLNIFSTRKLWALNSDETLIFTGTALDEEIIHFLVAFVLIPLNAIPS